jgi:hypothetical protein
MGRAAYKVDMRYSMIRMALCLSFGLASFGGPPAAAATCDYLLRVCIGEAVAQQHSCETPCSASHWACRAPCASAEDKSTCKDACAAAAVACEGACATAAIADEVACDELWADCSGCAPNASWDPDLEACLPALGPLELNGYVGPDEAKGGPPGGYPFSVLVDLAVLEDAWFSYAPGSGANGPKGYPVWFLLRDPLTHAPRALVMGGFVPQVLTDDSVHLSLCDLDPTDGVAPAPIASGETFELLAMDFVALPSLDCASLMSPEMAQYNEPFVSSPPDDIPIGVGQFGHLCAPWTYITAQ